MAVNISWKRDLTESHRLLILQNNVNEKEITEVKVKMLNSWKKKNVHKEIEDKNQKLISTRWKSWKMKDWETITKENLLIQQRSITSIIDCIFKLKLEFELNRHYISIPTKVKKSTDMFI